MPLKHSTETWLVFLLGAVIALTGVACALLQGLSNPSLPWAIFFAISIAYPLSLYPLFRERRADYTFRLLHFVPAAMLLVWLLLRFLGFALPALTVFSKGFVWGWSLPVVTLGFLAVLWFCLAVLRQRRQRSMALLALFLPFVILAAAGEQMQWPQQLAALLGGSQSSSGSGTIIAGPISSESSSNLSPSLNENEEKWRAELRRLERRKERLAALENQPSSVNGAKDGVIITGSQSSQVAAIPTKPVQNPPHLPSSGFGMEVFVPLAMAGYCATLHRRAKRRA